MCVFLGAIVGQALGSDSFPYPILRNMMREVNCLHLGWIQTQKLPVSFTTIRFKSFISNNLSRLSEPLSMISIHTQLASIVRNGNCQSASPP